MKSLSLILTLESAWSPKVHEHSSSTWAPDWTKFAWSHLNKIEWCHIVEHLEVPMVMWSNLMKPRREVPSPWSYLWVLVRQEGACSLHVWKERTVNRTKSRECHGLNPNLLARNQHRASFQLLHVTGHDQRTLALAWNGDGVCSPGLSTLVSPTTGFGKSQLMLHGWWASVCVYLHPGFNERIPGKIRSSVVSHFNASLNILCASWGTGNLLSRAWYCEMWSNSWEVQLPGSCRRSQKSLSTLQYQAPNKQGELFQGLQTKARIQPKPALALCYLHLAMFNSRSQFLVNWAWKLFEQVRIWLAAGKPWVVISCSCYLATFTFVRVNAVGF